VWDTLLVRLHHVCHIARMIRLQQSMQTAGFDGLGHRVLVEQHLVAFRIRLRVGEVIAGWGVEGGGEARSWIEYGFIQTSGVSDLKSASRVEYRFKSQHCHSTKASCSLSANQQDSKLLLHLTIILNLESQQESHESSRLHQNRKNSGGSRQKLPG